MDKVNSIPKWNHIFLKINSFIIFGSKSNSIEKVTCLSLFEMSIGRSRLVFDGVTTNFSFN